MKEGNLVCNSFTQACYKYEISDHRVMCECLFGGDVHIQIVGTFVVTHQKHLKHLKCA